MDFYEPEISLELLASELAMRADSVVYLKDDVERKRLDFESTRRRYENAVVDHEAARQALLNWVYQLPNE